MIECQVDEVVLKGPRTDRTFLLRVPTIIFERSGEAIIRQLYSYWREIWNDDPPRLLVLPDSFTLESLTDDQLMKAGLVRIKRSEI